MTCHTSKPQIVLAAVAIVVWATLAPAFAAPDAAPPPPGKLVDLGGHNLHVNCAGRGSPTVIVEAGLGDFSFDWILVQERVSKSARICTYDRAGYAWSDPGPIPRTFGQINLELHDALARLDERGPFVLVGHSFGGPVIRNYAATYPTEVAGMILVDAAFEGQRVGIGGNKTMKLGTDARGLAIPPPHEQMTDADQHAAQKPADPGPARKLDAIYTVLPPKVQAMQLWAEALPGIQDAENSQRQWSSEYFAKWLTVSQDGAFGAIPVIVLTRAEGGYDRDLDVTAAELEKERLEGQAMLARLSTNAKHIFLKCGHNMELEDPAGVSLAISEVIKAVNSHARLN
jgi:pimeloyl-ACP methyl ester carboxylesterase